tara:strand:- start:83 stop:487 length:405 start_codon:yes stop_codon:yes gene_type:complete
MIRVEPFVALRRARHAIDGIKTVRAYHVTSIVKRGIVSKDPARTSVAWRVIVERGIVPSKESSKETRGAKEEPASREVPIVPDSGGVVILLQIRRFRILSGHGGGTFRHSDTPFYYGVLPSCLLSPRICTKQVV